MTERNIRTSEYVTLRDGSFPLPFAQQLEFSSPARGTLNIVHTGNLIPESHEIFVCAKGCLRGVVLTAAEAGTMGRYSALEIKEENILNGDMETMMIEGVSDIIAKLPYSPRAILLYISCQHFFMAYDREMVFEVLKDRFRDIEFADCYMIPTLRKSGITPDQKMRIQMYSMLKPAVTDESQINLMGSNHAIVDSCEVYTLLEKRGMSLTSVNDCESFDDYLDLARGRLNIIYEPIALMAAEDMEKRLGIPYVYLPNVYRADDIADNYRLLGEVLGEVLDEEELARSCEKAKLAVRETLAMVGDSPIAVDYTFGPRLLNLARFLAEEGFNVTDLFADGFFPEEEKDWCWLKENRPDIILHPTSRAAMRYEKDINPGALALGQKAACFMGTDNFVNVAECGGFFGYDGIVQIMKLLQEACRVSKDREVIVQKKGTKVRSLLDEADSLCCREQPEKKLESTGNNYTAGLVPTYSSDEFGICSALYELGGMVVMHDASGCNSTYTTHDEPRWYNQESMIYISAISEMEAIMGDDEKLIKDICDAAEALKPEFIAIVGAPIPYMIGTDFDAIANILEEKLGIPCVGFDANGMQNYTKGVAMATRMLVERFTETPVEKTMEKTVEMSQTFTINLLGATPLDFALNGTVASIKEWAKEHQMAVKCSFSMDSSLEEIKKAASADANLVLTYGGLAAAKLMKSKFGIPYTCGVPCGKLGDNLAKELRGSFLSADTDEAKGAERIKVAVIGEEITSLSLARALEIEYNFDARVLSAADTDKVILREKDYAAESEDAIIRILAELQPALVIADPFYQAIVPKEMDFYPRPHEAFSGRIYDGQNQNLINCSLREKLSGLEKYDA